MWNIYRNSDWLQLRKEDFYEERMSRRTLNSKEELIQTVEEIPTNIKQIIRQASLGIFYGGKYVR